MSNIATHKAQSIDAEILQEAQEILGDGFNDLLVQFKMDTKALLSTIEFSRASNDYQGIKDSAHSMKSASFQMGATKMNYYADEIENFLNASPVLSTIQDEKKLDDLIGNLREAFSTYQDDVLIFL